MNSWILGFLSLVILLVCQVSWLRLLGCGYVRLLVSQIDYIVYCGKALVSSFQINESGIRVIL